MAAENKANKHDPFVEARRLHAEAADCYSKGANKKAQSLLLRSLQVLESAEGPYHPDVAWLLNSLAAVYEDSCDYQKAERLYRRAVSIVENADGDDPDLQTLRVRSLCNLARTYRIQGSYEKTEPLLKRALAIAEETFGSKSIEVANVLVELDSTIAVNP